MNFQILVDFQLIVGIPHITLGRVRNTLLNTGDDLITVIGVKGGGDVLQANGGGRGAADDDGVGNPVRHFAFSFCLEVQGHTRKVGRELKSSLSGNAHNIMLQSCFASRVANFSENRFGRAGTRTRPDLTAFNPCPVAYD